MEYSYDDTKLALQGTLKRGHPVISDGLPGTTTYVLTSENELREQRSSGLTASHDDSQDALFNMDTNTNSDTNYPLVSLLVLTFVHDFTPSNTLAALRNLRRVAGCQQKQ